MPSAPPVAPPLLAWPDRRAADVLGVDHPLIQAPMAGAQGATMAIAVSEEARGAGASLELLAAVLEAWAERVLHDGGRTHRCSHVVGTNVEALRAVVGEERAAASVARARQRAAGALR